MSLSESTLYSAWRWDEWLRSIWTEAAVDQTRYYPCISLAGRKKTTTYPAETRNVHLSDMKVEHAVGHSAR
jgi:hypothetical protein